jgi:hypothetical protein
MCTSYISNYYLYGSFFEIINKKLEESDMIYDDVYILRVRDML